jgi:Cu-Zn family superoxide dismutase
MTRTLSALAIASAMTLGLSAQGMKHVDLKDAKGASVGMAMISAAKDGGISIDLDVKGLTPGDHAIHIHQVAKCEGPGFTTAGPHFNPAAKKHGLQSPEGPHAGDMMNFTVAANGTAKTTVTNKAVTMADGANSIYANGGTALMIHATADDMKTDPGGAAGDRIACGAIVK